MGKSRNAFYQTKVVRQRKSVDADFVVELVQNLRQMHPRAGTRKLMHYLQDDFNKADIAIGRDRLNEILRERTLLVERRRSQTPRTTRFDSSLPLAHNLIKDLQPSAPNEVWVGDITYIRTLEGFLYLSLLTDMVSRKIVGYDICESLETEGCLNALGMARKDLYKGEHPIHHSDRGCQYGSHAYRKALQEAGMPCSMTEEFHCYENALAERVNGILKQEYFLDVCFATKEAARSAVIQTVDIYNNHRIHEALGYRTPASVHRRAA